MKYRAEIDGLRALAVLPVIFFHAGFSLFEGGFVGVDIFFVISGYLITSIIISEIVEEKFTILNFYERRARRILPALFFVMAACLPFAWLWLAPNDLSSFGGSLIATSTFSSNIFFWLDSSYFGLAAELKPLLHTWSLAVEEQYYILFPIFLTLIWQLGIRSMIVLLFVIFFVSLGVSQWGAFNKPSATFFLLPTRGWELLIGVFIAFHYRYNQQIKSFAVNQALSLIGLVMIIYSIITFNQFTPFPSLYALVPTLGTALLILCSVPQTLTYKLLSFKPIVLTGLISYSAYLWHQPLLAFARHRLIGEVSDLLLISLCFISLLMAWMSWRYIEKPFRDKSLTTRKFIFTFSISGIAIFSLIGFLLQFERVTYSSLTNSQKIIVQNFKNPSAYTIGKFNSIASKPFSPDSNNKKVLIIGSSHAQDLTNVFFELGLDSKMDISTFYIQHSCRVLFIDKEELKKLRAPACLNKDNPLDSIELQMLLKQADEVWLASSWSHHAPKYMKESIEALQFYNNNIVVFGTKNFGEVSEGFYKITPEKKWANRQFSDIEISKFIKDDQLNTLLKDIVIDAGARFFNTQRMICDGEPYCDNFQEYDLISYDGSHLTPYGASLFAEKLKVFLSD